MKGGKFRHKRIIRSTGIHNIVAMSKYIWYSAVKICNALLVLHLITITTIRHYPVCQSRVRIVDITILRKQAR